MSLTEDLTYRLGDDGLILNSDASTPFLDVATVRGLDSAPVRSSTHAKEGADGGYVDAAYEDIRTIEVSGFVYGDSSDLGEVYLDSLLENFAPTANPVPFYYRHPGIGTRVVFVKSLGVKFDVDSLRRNGITPVTATMLAEDPRKYDSELSTVEVPFGSVITTGFGFPFGFPFGFGAAVTPDGKYVLNKGNRATPPTITVYGPVNRPEIRNDATSSVLHLNVNLGESDVVVFDMKDHTVSLNGGNVRGQLLTAGWFFLMPSNNLIRFHGLSGTPGTTKLNVSYRSAWR